MSLGLESRILKYLATLNPRYLPKYVERDYEEFLKRYRDLVERGICPVCGKELGSKASVFKHLRKSNRCKQVLGYIAMEISKRIPESRVLAEIG